MKKEKIEASKEKNESRNNNMKKDLPVSAFIRFTKDNRGYDHAMLVLRGENGREYKLLFHNFGGDNLDDLTIEILPPKNKK